MIRPQSPVAERRPARADAIDLALVAEAIPGVAWVLGPDGREVYANRSWRSYAGDQAGTSGWHEAVHPADREHLDAAWAEAVASNEPFAIEFRLRSKLGEYRWHIARGERAPDEAGRAWVLTATDVHEMRRAQERLGLLSRTNELLAEHADIAELFSRLTALVVPVLADWAAVEMVDGDGHAHRVAWAGTDEDAAGHAGGGDVPNLTGPEGEPRGGARRDAAERDAAAPVVGGPDAGASVRAGPRGGRAGMVVEAPLAIREGDRLGSLVLGRRAAPFDRDDLRLAEDLARRAAAILDRERLYDAERRSREASARFMAEASQVLGESLDHEATVASLATLAVPRIADWCSVEMLEPDGSARQLAVAHVDPDKLALARRLRQQYPLGPDAPMGAPAVGRTGVPEVLWEIPQETLDSLSPDPELRRIVNELGLRSYMCVPMVGPEGVIGAITFVQGPSGRTFDEQDLALATELARHAATAIEHARLYRDVTRLAATLDAVRDAILVFDPQALVFTHVNQGAVDQVGYTREELLRMTPLDVKPLYDERAYRGLIEPLVDGTLRSRTISTLHRHKDGRLIPVEVSMQFVKLDGADGRLVSIARDVTERVEAEARLHRLAQSEQSRAAEFAAVIGAIGDAVVVCSPRGDVTHVNPAARRLFGGSLATWERVHDQLEDADGRAPAPGVPAQQGPVELRRRGRDQWLAVTAYPVLGEPPQAGTAGRPVIATIMLIRDVTEGRHAQRAQEAFIGVLSHELRTPVTTIYGGAKVLGERGDTLAPDVRADVYRDIAAESERLYRLVEDLLVLARFEGVMPGSLGDEPVLLQRILPAIIDVERSRFPATIFATEMAPGLPTVRAERTYVEQVTRNLLANAAKYSPTGSTVRMQIAATEGAVEVRVTDEGPGFPEEEAERLFELFYRSPSTARVASGAGIGLFVCRRLVEAMGGRMWARPRPEGGSEFGFSLITFNEEEA